MKTTCRPIRKRGFPDDTISTRDAGSTCAMSSRQAIRRSSAATAAGRGRAELYVPMTAMPAESVLNPFVWAPITGFVMPP